MIIFIVSDSYENFCQGGWLKARHTLQEIARDECLALHYTQVSLDLVRRLQPWAICGSGGSAPYDSYDILSHAAYRRVVTGAGVPQIGICRSHQLLTHYFGGRIGLMRKLKPDEPDAASYSPGYFKEWGVCPVRVVENDPLFAGCGKIIRVHQAHAWEVKRIGAGFMLLAGSVDCKVQAVRHRRQPIYGVQFHPEVRHAAYPDGVRILENFFKFARAWRG